MFVDSFYDETLNLWHTEIVLEYCLAISDLITNIFHNGDPIIERTVSEKERRLIRLATGRVPCDSLQARDFLGRNVLHLAVEGERVALAKWFLEKGVDVSAADNCGMQPLHCAAMSRCPKTNNELVNLLLDHGANVNARTRDDTTFDATPLHFATAHENAVMVKTLLERGADVDLRITGGRTALHIACQKSNDLIIRILLSAGANVVAEDGDGKTPFSLMFWKRLETPIIMTKALALKKVCQPLIEVKDERIMRKYPWLWSYYRDCHAHISRMEFTEFVNGCTFFELLTKKPSQIAPLMRNRYFKANFELHDLSRFSMYAEDVLGAFERVRNRYHSMLEQEDVIN